MIDEFRRARRRKVADTVIVVDTMVDSVVGRLGNLSETGMLLMANMALTEDALYQFRFNLNDPQGARRRWKWARTCCGRTRRTPRASAGQASASSRSRKSTCASCATGSTGRADSSSKRGRTHHRAACGTIGVPRVAEHPHAPRPAALYADHLYMLKRRADEALHRGGFDALVVPSGRLHYQVFDDRDYPFAVNRSSRHGCRWCACRTAGWCTCRASGRR
jgi:Xaa-Pro dipeptidase